MSISQPVSEQSNEDQTFSWPLSLNLTIGIIGWVMLVIGTILYHQSPLFKNKIVSIFTQDTTSKTLTLSIILGVVSGIFPIPLVATGVSLLMGQVFTVNFPIMMAANYLASPIEYLLLIPFARSGDWIKQCMYGLMDKEFEPFDVTKLTKGGVWHGIQTCSGAFSWACLAWLIITPIPTVILYHALKPVFVKLTDHFKSKYVNGDQQLEAVICDCSIKDPEPSPCNL